MTKEQLLAAAMALPADERQQIADALFESVAEGTREEIDAAWIAECKRRLEAYKRGEVQATPVDEVIERIRSRVRQ